MPSVGQQCAASPEDGADSGAHHSAQRSAPEQPPTSGPATRSAADAVQQQCCAASAVSNTARTPAAAMVRMRWSKLVAKLPHRRKHSAAPGTPSAANWPSIRLPTRWSAPRANICAAPAGVSSGHGWQSSTMCDPFASPPPPSRRMPGLHISLKSVASSTS